MTKNIQKTSLNIEMEKYQKLRAIASLKFKKAQILSFKFLE